MQHDLGRVLLLSFNTNHSKRNTIDHLNYFVQGPAFMIGPRPFRNYMLVAERGTQNKLLTCCILKTMSCMEYGSR